MPTEAEKREVERKEAVAEAKLVANEAARIEAIGEAAKKEAIKTASGERRSVHQEKAQEGMVELYKAVGELQRRIDRGEPKPKHFKETSAEDRQKVDALTERVKAVLNDLAVNDEPVK